MISWIFNNLIGIISIIVGGFIAYHVYFLSKKIDLKDRLSHKENIRKTVDQILHESSRGISSRCELVNVKKYLTHYPDSNDKNKNGYTYFGGELKALRFNGVEFFCGARELYKTNRGDYSLQKKDNDREKFNAFEVGVVPYEWIEHIDPDGDEFSYRPQFFAKFKGLHKTPYKYVIYYIESDTYNKDSDPMDMRWRSIKINDN